MPVAIVDREPRVAELMGIINAATAELTAVIASVLEDGSWQIAGVRSPEHWARVHCGLSARRAIDLVRLAERRKELPECVALFDAGLITEDAACAIARRAPAERDAELAELAPHLMHPQLLRALRSFSKPKPKKPEPERQREVSFGADEDGWWRMIVGTSLDDGSVFELALRRARDQLFHERHPDQETENPRTSTITWADALRRMADLALANLDGAGRRPGERYQVVFHLDPTQGDARLHLGPILPDTLRRYLLCDADVRAMFEHNDVLLAMTSRLRTVDDRMRSFIENRDGGCRVPGCEQTWWLHIHHIVHWEDGGTTTSENLCCLCPYHHRLHHEGLLGITGDPSTSTGLIFTDKYGRPIVPVAPTPPEQLPDPPETPYVHPTGEHVDWRWVSWQDFERWHQRHGPPNSN